MDFVTGFNLVEALWWIGLGLVLLRPWSLPDVPRLRRSLAAVLIVFGVSDLFELWSGAWWRPWWLVTIKIACGATIAALVLLWFWTARHRSAR